MTLKTAGIKNLKLPVQVMQKDGNSQHTVATISLYVQMPSVLQIDGITVVTAILNRYLDRISVRHFPELLADVRAAFNARSARIDMAFPYYLEKAAPITGTRSLMEYQCMFSGEVGQDQEDGFILTVKVPVTTLCPCSREISKFGAHNQRAEITMSARFTKMIWAEDLIALVEQCASCELFALLKRPDEKYVTEKAFSNPMFVEDVVRKVALMALGHPLISWFSVGVESFESIHKHSAYAYVDSGELAVRPVDEPPTLNTTGCSPS